MIRLLCCAQLIASYMITQRQLFLNHLAQTSSSPLLLEPDSAKGIYIYDVNGKEYTDLISGISVSNIGHCNPMVIGAIEKQLHKYMHLMVYGEYVQSPQVKYAKLLIQHLPAQLDCVYFTNSGTEAVEGALKLAKRLTGRSEIISFRKSYHGSSQGALSIMGDEDFRNSFRPLIPGNRLLRFNSFSDLEMISGETAAVILEPVQSEAGVILPERKFLELIRKRCDETGALMILDECQTGMGRTGSMFYFSQHHFTPDILILAKALGGGMPLGAFISSAEKMNAFTHSPFLGHITTFGGHPVCCAAGMAAMEVLLEGNIIESVNEKSGIFSRRLKHPAIKNYRSAGLLISLEFENELINNKIIEVCLQNGLITDWFLFADHCMRIAPPLTITGEQINASCSVILQAIEAVTLS